MSALMVLADCNYDYRQIEINWWSLLKWFRITNPVSVWPCSMKIFLYFQTVFLFVFDHGHVNQTLTIQKAFPFLSIHFQMSSPFQNHESILYLVFPKKPKLFWKEIKIRMTDDCINQPTNQPTTQNHTSEILPALNEAASFRDLEKIFFFVGFFSQWKIGWRKKISHPQGLGVAYPNLYRWCFSEEYDYEVWCKFIWFGGHFAGCAMLKSKQSSFNHHFSALRCYK